MNFYLFFRKLHLYFTLVALVPLTIISVTGLLLLFEVEITQWQASESHKIDDQLITTPQSIDRLHQHIEQLLAENPQCDVSYMLHNAQAESLPIIYLSCPDELKTLVVNLSTNQYYRYEKEGFQLILDLHRTLLLGNVGQNLVGIATLVVIFNIVLGLVLWFIRGKKVKLNKQKFSITLSRGLNLRNLHSVTALYLTPMLLIMALTGISWTWREPIYQGLAYLQNKDQALPAVLTEAKSHPANLTAIASIRAIYNKMQQDYPQHQVLGLAPARIPTDIVTVRLRDKEGLGFTPHLYLTLDAYTLQEKYKTDGWQASAKDSIYSYRIMQYGLHTGFLFGSAGKIIWAIADVLFIASILILGIYLWQKRRRKEIDSKQKSLI
jgi:uncharacterized iron-regulated membrane protein